MTGALPALAAVPARPTTAAADTASGEDASAGGGFAAALELACEPAKTPAKGVAKAAAKGLAKAGKDIDAKAGTKPDACIEAASDSEAAVDEGDDRPDGTAPDLADLLPGWPAAPAGVPPATASAPAIATAAVAAATAAAADPNFEIAGHALADPNARKPAPAGIASVARSERLEAADAVEDAPAIAHAAGNKLVTDSKSRGAPDITPSPPSTPRPSTPSTPTAAIEPAQPAGPSNSAADPAAPAAPPWPAHATPLPQPAANNAAPANASVNTALSFEGRLAAALESPAFAPALATQVSWLASEGVQHARLNLNPLEMGPLAVKIVLDGTQARIDFTADMAGTRAAIEASLPTLAAALNDNGLTLAGGGVFDGQARQGAHGGPGARGPQLPGHQAAAATLAAGADVTGSLPVRVARGLVDLIA